MSFVIEGEDGSESNGIIDAFNEARRSVGHHAGQLVSLYEVATGIDVAKTVASIIRLSDRREKRRLLLRNFRKARMQCSVLAGLFTAITCPLFGFGGRTNIILIVASVAVMFYLMGVVRMVEQKDADELASCEELLVSLTKHLDGMSKIIDKKKDKTEEAVSSAIQNAAALADKTHIPRREFREIIATISQFGYVDNNPEQVAQYVLDGTIDAIVRVRSRSIFAKRSI